MGQVNSNDSKVTSLTDAVGDLVTPGSIVGLGGQNINRCPMAITHEIVRQGVGDLAIVGCNLSLPLDLMAAAGLVRRTEQGSGNLERYGTLFAWRRQVETGEIQVRDYSHLAMASRFLAGSLGLPFMPIRSLLGTSLLDRLIEHGDAKLSRDPWTNEPVALVRALNPDVSIIHANQADETGNVIIDGVTSHEIDCVKASRANIVTVEEVLPAGAFGSRAETITISGAYVDAVVAQPYGAFPTSVYRRYDYFEDDITDYQRRARSGGADLNEYLDEWIHSTRSFDEYLDKRDPESTHRQDLEQRMRSLL